MSSDSNTLTQLTSHPAKPQQKHPAFFKFSYLYFRNKSSTFCLCKVALATYSLTQWAKMFVLHAQHYITNVMVYNSAYENMWGNHAYHVASRPGYIYMQSYVVSRS